MRHVLCHLVQNPLQYKDGLNMHLLLTIIFLLSACSTAYGGFFDSYPRGKKGDVIAELRNKDRSEWKPDVLFFGGPDEDFNFRACEEYRDIMNERLSFYEYRCVPNR